MRASVMQDLLVLWEQQCNTPLGFVMLCQYVVQLVVFMEHQFL